MILRALSLSRLLVVSFIFQASASLAADLPDQAPVSALTGKTTQITFLIEGAGLGGFGRKRLSVPDTLEVEAGATRMNLVKSSWRSLWTGDSVSFDDSTANPSASHCYYRLYPAQDSYTFDNRQSFAITTVESLVSDLNSDLHSVFIGVDHPKVREIVCHFYVGARPITIADLREQFGFVSTQ